MLSFRTNTESRIQVEEYSEISQAYWVTNESTQYVCGKLAEQQSKGEVIYSGVLGGLDAALSHISTIDQNEGTEVSNAFLSDVNEKALGLGEARLNLVNVAESPQEYLGFIIPADINFMSLLDISDPYEINRRAEAVFNFEEARTINALRVAGYSLEQARALLESVKLADNGMVIRVKGNKVWLGADVRYLLRRIVNDEKHWLSLKNPKNFQTIKRLVGEGRIHTMHAAIQGVAMGPMLNFFHDAGGIDYLYLSNINTFMSDADYEKMIIALRSLSNQTGRSTDVIFSRNRTLADGNYPDEVINDLVPLSDIEENSEIRPDRDRYPSILV